jgi:DhnA family fructose-bisphosphate aldolase class Ia
MNFKELNNILVSNQKTKPIKPTIPTKPSYKTNESPDLSFVYGNMELYTDANPDQTIKVGYKDEKAALESLNKISKKSKPYQIKVIITLYYRAKFHPSRTKSMEKAMKIFKHWLKENSPGINLS